MTRLQHSAERARPKAQGTWLAMTRPLILSTMLLKEITKVFHRKVILAYNAVRRRKYKMPRIRNIFTHAKCKVPSQGRRAQLTKKRA